MKLRKIPLLLILLPSLALAAEYTNQDTIGPIEYDGNTNKFFLSNSTSSGRGASGCPNARYVLADTTMPGLKEFISVSLAAKMASRNVKFYSDCDPASEHNFIAYYVTVY